MLNKPLDIIFPERLQYDKVKQLDLKNLPNHVSIIMDGNGRWAKKRGKIRLQGHKAGVKSVKDIVRCASDLGIKYLSLYSFSTENWSRPKEEVIGLMDLFAKSVIAEMDELHANNVKIKFLGDISILPPKTINAFNNAYKKMKDNNGLVLMPAVNYGSRSELLNAAKQLAKDCIVNGLDEEKNFADNNHANNDTYDKNNCKIDFEKTIKNIDNLSEDDFANCLYTKNIPDPELLIRTSGEMRISNYLLWQIAYSEFYVTDVLWPDFNRYCFLDALLAYQQRNRRFGGV